MFVQMILDHIPRSWKAACALLLIFIAFPYALTTFTVLLIDGGRLLDWTKFIVSMTVGVTAAVMFYTEQFQAGHIDSYDKVHINTLAQHHKEISKSKSTGTKGWHMNDIADKKPRITKP